MAKSRLIAILLASTLSLGAAQAQNAGAYLSAIHANMQNDYRVAAQYFQEALQADPGNPFLLHNAMLAFVAKGDVERALRFAERLEEKGEGTQLSDLIILAAAIKDESYDDAARVLETKPDSFTDLMRGLMWGWVELGRGKMTAAAAQFDGMTEPEAVAMFGQYHKALALAVVGDFGGADKILTGDERGSLRLNRGSLLAHAQILSQIEQAPEAVKLLDDALNGTQDKELSALRDAIAEQGAVDYTFITNARQGAAEVFFTLASALRDDRNQHSTLLYTRISQYLRPNNTPAILLAAEVLRAQGQYDLATQIYTEVPQDDAMFLNAELGRADTLIDAEKVEAAIEVLRGLTRSHASVPRVHMSLGDALRGQEQYEEARDAYLTAVEKIESPQANHWFLFYALGICSERLDDWDRAEADFRKALELSPDQPLVLNYLGYSLVEQRLKLDEAQKMIETAVAKRPDSGFITDSLGWVLYRLGKFDEAVAPMEKAVELLPDDPIINDHLGDVYWMVGRTREAEFQWKRALSFGPEEEEGERIRLKLEQGLDAVLESEARLEAAKDAN